MLSMSNDENNIIRKGDKYMNDNNKKTINEEVNTDTMDITDDMLQNLTNNKEEGEQDE